MSTRDTQATPPGSFTNLPLTPPPTEKQTIRSVSRIEDEIRKRKEGSLLHVEPWMVYPLNAKEYQDLFRSLEKDHSLYDYIKHKLRYDYMPSFSQLVLRMPTQIHEAVIIKVVEELQRQLRSIADGSNQSAEFARGLRSGGSATIAFDELEYGEHSPDAQFRYWGEKYPGVVIEVSYSQKRKDLDRLADDYILGSDGDIRVVIGIDIEYRGRKKATLSVWRPQVVYNDDEEPELVAAQTVNDLIFRNEDGSSIPSLETGLTLELQDFASEDLTQPYESLRDPIHISANTLCGYLDEAEKEADTSKHQEIVRKQKPWIRKRRREDTPPEELEQEREKDFQHKERKSAERAEKDDSSYKASSTSDTESI